MLARGVSFEERIAAASRASLAAHTPPPPPPPPPRPSVAVAAGEERVDGEEAAMAAAEALRAALEQKLAQRTAERDEARRPPARATCTDASTVQTRADFFWVSLRRGESQSSH